MPKKKRSLHGDFLWRQLEDVSGPVSREEIAFECFGHEGTSHLGRLLTADNLPSKGTINSAADYVYKKGDGTGTIRDFKKQFYLAMEFLSRLHNGNTNLNGPIPDLASPYLISVGMLAANGDSPTKPGPSSSNNTVSGKEPQVHKSMSGTTAQSPLIRRLIHASQAGYVSNKIEDIILEELKNSDNCRILITGLAGSGKTALMTKLSRSATLGVNIAFFFVDDPSITDRNGPSDFYKSVFGQLSNHYGISFVETWRNTRDAGEILGSWLLELAETGAISKEKPLTFFVDALDEMQGAGETSSVGDRLFLPEVDIPGVSFVISERLDSVQDLRGKRRLPRHTHHIDLTRGDHAEIHRQTVERYVRRRCEADERIARFHLLETSEDEALFVRNLCEDAKFNFMILRCALNETEILGEIGDIRLGSTLSEYYEGHLYRMTKGRNSLDRANVLFCMTFEPEILLDTYLYLQNAQFSAYQTDPNFDALNEWVRQGLISVASQNGLATLSMYHRTYREFLASERDKEYSKGEFERIVLDRIQDQVPVSLEKLRGTSAAKIKFASLLELSQKLAAKSRNFEFIGALICENSLWNRMRHFGIPFDFALRNIASAKKNGFDDTEVDLCYQKVAKFLLALADGDQLLDSNGGIVDRFRLYRIVYNTRDTSENDEVHLVDYLLDEITKETEDDD